MTFMVCSPPPFHLYTLTFKWVIWQNNSQCHNSNCSFISAVVANSEAWILLLKLSINNADDIKILQKYNILTANSNGNLSAAHWHLKLWSHSSSELGCNHMCCGSMNRRMCLEASSVVRGKGEISPSYPQIPVYYPGNAAKSPTTATNSLFDFKVFIFSTSISLIRFIYIFNTSILMLIFHNEFCFVLLSSISFCFPLYYLRKESLLSYRAKKGSNLDNIQFCLKVCTL